MNKRILTTILIIVSMISMTACNGGSGEAKDNIKYATPAEHIIAAWFNTIDITKIGINAKVSCEGEFDKIIEKIAADHKTEITDEQKRYIKFANVVLNGLTFDYVNYFEFDKKNFDFKLYNDYNLLHNKQKLITINQYN